MKLRPLQGLDSCKKLDGAMTHFQNCPGWRPGKGKEVVYVIPETWVNDMPVEICMAEDETVTIIVSPGANATILEKTEGCANIDILVHPNAFIKYFSETTDKQISRHAHLMSDASIMWVDATSGTSRIAVTSFLAGKGSNARFESVVLGKDKNKCDVKSMMIHAGPNSTSNMLTRAVMFDESEGVYKGMIRIEKDAKDCDAYQKEETILLSENAKMDAEPNLEINNENVKCSHGVSLGQLDDELIFYFRTRGIPTKTAVQLILHGFFDGILSRMGSHGEHIKQKMFMKVSV